MSTRADARIRSRRREFLAVVSFAVVAFAAIASFAHAPPQPEDGDKACPHFNEDWTGLKVEPVEDGTYTDGTLSVTLKVDKEKQTFDWTSNIGVDAVFVKGGPSGNLYTYNPEATSAENLHAPLNDSTEKEGDFYGLSHVSFCYDKEKPPTDTPSPEPSDSETPSPEPSDSETPSPEPSDSETPSPEPSDSETPSPEPSDSETPSPEPSDSETPSPEPSDTETPGTTVSPTATSTSTSPTVLGTKTLLPQSGTDVMRLVWGALAMVALGLFGYVVARRAPERI